MDKKKLIPAKYQIEPNEKENKKINKIKTTRNGIKEALHREIEREQRPITAINTCRSLSVITSKIKRIKSNTYNTMFNVQQSAYK